MIIRRDGKYFLVLQTSTSGFTTDIHIQNIATGEENIITDKEMFDDYCDASVSEALPAFFDAQWIGEANLEKMTIAMLQEVSEAFNELDWKPWKEKPINMKAYREELADVGIFLLLCAKIAGMTSDDLLLEMFNKHLYNLVRKDHKRGASK